MMGDLIYSVGGFLVALGILVTFHEYGHFWVARRLGVKVLRFSVGFGRPLWRRRARDGVEYVVAALPLGGYVKMLDETEGEVPPAERHRAFNRQPLYKRSLIVAAGPAANFLFAVLAYWVVFLVGVEGVKPVVGHVVAGSLAEAAGFRRGDLLVAVDGRPVRSWSEPRMELFERALNQEAVPFTVRTADGRLETRVLDFSRLPAREIDSAFLERAVGLIGYLPEFPPVAGAVQPGSPAAAAGLAPGDRILAVDGRPVASWQEVVEAVRAAPGRALVLQVQRGGETRELTVVPEAVAADGGAIGRIGVQVAPVPVPPEMRVRLTYGPLEALGRALHSTWLMSALTVRMLYKMLLLEVSVKNISGPLTIAQYAGHSAQLGLDRFLLFLALVSVSLGVLNLLPIPVLDGGHLLYHAVEAVRGAPLSQEVMLWGQQIGILLLIGLMGLAFYNDLLRLLQ